ncbi:hypothetical protein Tco_0419132 [Tanacetum coccineum]
MTVPSTTEEKICKKNDVKARSLLLMALPNEHQLTFNQYVDAQSMFAAIKARVERGIRNKRTQKALLKPTHEEKVHRELEMKIMSLKKQTARYDKSKLNVTTPKMGQFSRECRAPKSKEQQKLESGKETKRFEFKMQSLKISKDLDQLLASQITDKSKKGFGYNVVPSPHPLILNRPTPLDLSYSGLQEFKQPPETDTSYYNSPPKIDKDWKEKLFCPANQVMLKKDPKKAKENNDSTNH